jgi:hypothetical protein
MSFDGIDKLFNATQGDFYYISLLFAIALECRNIRKKNLISECPLIFFFNLKILEFSKNK